jgi:hypothetical protein
MSEPDLVLPPVHVAEIDRDKLRELFDDVEALGERLEIVLKRATEAHVEDGPSVSLAEALEQLSSGTAIGAQLRYSYEGVEWWDTLLRAPRGFRLVRIQHRPPVA